MLFSDEENSEENIASDELTPEVGLSMPLLNEDLEVRSSSPVAGPSGISRRVRAVDDTRSGEAV